MNSNEIINKVDLRDKYGTGSDIIEALSLCRSLFSRVGKEWNESNREEKNYFLVKEFEKHLMMIHESCILTEKKNSTSKRKQRGSEASKLSPRPESNNKLREKKVKTNSYDTSVPNNLSCKPSLEASAQIQQDQTHQNRWKRRYEELKSRVEICGNTRASNNIPSNSSPGISVGEKRHSYEKYQNGDSSILTENRIQALNKVSLESEIHRIQAWERNYRELVNFVREFGHARVPEHFPPNPSLGHWVERQRYNYKRYQNGDSSNITEPQIQLLSKVGFEWKCNITETWYRSDEELVSFVEEFGHARVPNNFPQNPSLGIWVDTQRQSYKTTLKEDASSNMTEGRIRHFDKVGFVSECRHGPPPWDGRYKELISFVEKFGHARVPTKFPANPSLGEWVKTQRQIYINYFKGDVTSKMVKDRIELLNKVGFEWGRCHQPWEDMYEKLVSFVQGFGHARVPHHFPPNPSLGTWVDSQRRNYKKFLKGDFSSKMTENPNLSLGNWIERQQYNYEKSLKSDASSNMTEDRIQLLKKIGFEWECQHSPPSWNRRYMELVSFVGKFGHARVPHNFPKNISLGEWVHNQRRHVKNYIKGDASSKMTKDRIELLNKVGFEWGRCCLPWENMYKKLVSFVHEFGHAKVPRQYPENPSLGIWVVKQRQSYKKFLNDDSSSNMTKDRIQLLNKVGFEWNLRHCQPWGKQFEELVNFVQVFGHTRVPTRFPQNLSLGIWVATQRRHYKKFLKDDSSSFMTADRIQLLNKVGFEWVVNRTLEYPS